MRYEKHNTLEYFIRYIETRPLFIEEFDRKLWIAIIDKVTVLPDGRILVFFKDGTAIESSPMIDRNAMDRKNLMRFFKKPDWPYSSLLGKTIESAVIQISSASVSSVVSKSLSSYCV